MIRTKAELAVELCGIPMKTPLIPASGTLAKEALEEVRGVYGIMLPKTVTPVRREGNPPPRIAETPSGMINSIGLQNPGVDSFLQDLDAFGDEAPLMVSVAGDTVAEFVALCERVAADGRIVSGGTEPFVPERRAWRIDVLRRPRERGGGRKLLPRGVTRQADIRQADERGCSRQRRGR